MRDLEFLLNNKGWIIRLIEKELPLTNVTSTAEELFNKAIEVAKSGTVNLKKASKLFSNKSLEVVLAKFS